MSHICVNEQYLSCYMSEDKARVYKPFEGNGNYLEILKTSVSVGLFFLCRTYWIEVLAA